VVLRVSHTGPTVFKIIPGKGTIVLQLIDSKTGVEKHPGNPVRVRSISHALSLTRYRVPPLPYLPGTNHRWSR
jgi:hypothetical protein